MADANANAEENDDEPHREQWANKAEFVLSCIGYSVGLGNVWRFSYVAYENGGGAFLLPYFILLLVVGKPMYMMELILGQFSALGPLKIWKFFPIFKGIGYSMVAASLIVAIYYNVIMGYTVYYFFISFFKVLPWSDCFEWWGADSNCYVRQPNQSICRESLSKMVSSYNKSIPTDKTGFVNVTSGNAFAFVPEDFFTKEMSNCTNASETSSEQFFNRFVLDISSGINDVGVLRWDLAVSLFFCWMIIFLILIRGIKSAGKVVYFTATFPYVILIALLCYGVQLEGSGTGIKFFFIPNWQKLKSLKVWRNAAEQLLFSLGVSWGTLLVFSSYNKFDNKVHRDAMFVSFLDFLTSLLSGIVIFSVLGNMSKRMGLTVKNVVKGGQGLAFIAYPEALAQLPVPQVWSVLFFFMLFLLAVDSLFSYLEIFFAAIYDVYPHLRRRKTMLTFSTCIGCFLLGLPLVTQGGPYLLKLVDNYASGSVLFICFCELLAVMWGYGLKRFCYDTKFMLGFYPNLYWRICWAFIDPIVILILCIYSLYALLSPEPLELNKRPFPRWTKGLGWMITLFITLFIPLYAAYVLFKNRKNPRILLVPSKTWGPLSRSSREEYFKEVEVNFPDKKKKSVPFNEKDREESSSDEEDSEIAPNVRPEIRHAGSHSPTPREPIT